LRVNQGDRVLLFSVVQQEHYLLLDVGSHDTIYRRVQRLS
jgi:mRNA-degrading endonuclease YafQ of YafQ-DinJ toxin-antitoxin module